jgi:hypothetical protein
MRRSGKRYAPERIIFLIYRKLRKTRAISRFGGMNPPSLSLAGRDDAFGKALRARTLFYYLNKALRAIQGLGIDGLFKRNIAAKTP